MQKIRFKNFLYSKLVSFIIVFIILLSHCYTEGIPSLDYFVTRICLLFSIILILFYILNGEISKICLSIILYCIFLFISTLLGEHSSITSFFIYYFRIIALAFYLDYGLKYYSKNITHSFYISYSILIFLNFFTLIIFPNGLFQSELSNRNWFFGYDNGHIFMYIPALMFMAFDKEILNRKFDFFDIVLFSVITYSVFFCFSATSVVGYTILLIYLLLRKYINKLNILNAITCFLAYIATFFGFIILRIQEYFSHIIVNLLKKDLTFTGRTIIWDNTIEFIKQQPLLGFGKEEGDIIASKLGGESFLHAHNTILDVLYKGGIISLIIFFIILILPIKKLYKYRKYEISKFLSVILFSLFLMMNFEARQENIGLYIVLISCFNIDYLLKHFHEYKSKNYSK